MKAKIFYAIRDNGDGSASVLFFRTQKAFEKYEEDDSNREGFAEFCGGSIEVNIDKESGAIISNPKYEKGYQEDNEYFIEKYGQID